MALDINPIGTLKDVPSEAPKIYSDRYKHSIVDSSYQPETSILSLVSGTPMLTEYYRIFANSLEEPTPFQPKSLDLYQSYTRIKNAVIKLDGEGAFSFNADTGESSKDYSAHVIFDLTPIRGDCFIADIGDGNAGLFTVTEQPEIRNATANKVYLITFKLMCILTTELYQTLNRRVVQELQYSKDSALRGGNAVITTGEYELEEQLMSWLPTIVRNIFQKYYWNPERTIALVDVNEHTVYDQYLAEFLRGIIPNELTDGHPTINLLSSQYGGREIGYYTTRSIWDVLLRGDWNMLPELVNRIAVVDVNRLYGTRSYGSVRNSKFDKLLVTDPENYQLMEEYYNMDGYPILNYAADMVSTYMFSVEFYKGKPQTEIEVLTRDILKNKLIDRKRLLAYCEGYFNLNKWEQLYYGAILIMLIQVTRKVNTGF